MKFKDIAYIIENVRKLVVWENNKRKEIPVYNAISGESRSYFEYEVYKITTMLTTDITMLDSEANIKSIIVIYLKKEND